MHLHRLSGSATDACVLQKVEEIEAELGDLRSNRQMYPAPVYKALLEGIENALTDIQTINEAHKTDDDFLMLPTQMEGPDPLSNQRLETEVIKNKRDVFVEYEAHNKSLLIPYSEDEMIEEVVTETRRMMSSMNIFLGLASNYYVGLEKSIKEINKGIADVKFDTGLVEEELSKAEKDFHKASRKKRR